MNENELDQFEAELRGLAPARLPDPLMARLLAAEPGRDSRPNPAPRRPAGGSDWFGLWRWLAPVAAAVAVVVGVWWHGSRARSAPVIAAVKADRLQVNQQLVSSFDTVAQLPTGEPVRFRVRQWQDQVVVNDKDRGLIVEQNRPRLEVVPVRFETY